MIFILVHILAFLQEMFFNLFDLNDLLALPAAGEHWAFLPVMDVKFVFIETFFCVVAEVTASTFVIVFSRLLLFLTVILIFEFFLLLWSSFIWSWWIANICLDNFFLWRWSLFLWLFRWSSSILVNFLELRHQNIKLCLFHTFIVLWKLISTH